MFHIIFVSLLGFAWLVIVKILRIGQREKTLPPGPPTIPILGNATIYPKENAHYKFTEWAREYGDVVSLKIAHTNVIVLSSMPAVRELLDKRSTVTGDRPINHMVKTITGGVHIALAGFHSDVWRVGRKAASAILTPKASARLFPIQQAEAMQLVFDFLKTPQDFYSHIQRYSYSSILSVVYGKRAPRTETRDMSIFFEVQHIWERVLDPGAFPPIDLLPFLKYIPERWASWKTLCKRARTLQRELYFRLLDECEARLKRNEENGCYIEDVVKQKEELGINREMIAYLGGVLMEGASDTTSAFLQTLVLALVAFPEKQRQAQEEIDRVIGDHRLPIREDFEKLPYIQAVIKETHRFRPGAPVGIPHRFLQDEEYGGYVIPKGSTVFMNIWGIYHDPELFDDPESWDPSRFLNNPYGTKKGVDGADLFNRPILAFGAGRRICLGMHMANNALMLNVMYLIWAFNFELAKDPETGATIPVDIHNYRRGMAGTPYPFSCSITPRNQNRVDLITHTFLEATDTFEKFERDLDPEEKEWAKSVRERV